MRWPIRCTGRPTPLPSAPSGGACPRPPSGRRRATTSRNESTLRPPRSATATPRPGPRRRWHGPTGWSGRGSITPPPGCLPATGVPRRQPRTWSEPRRLPKRPGRGARAGREMRAVACEARHYETAGNYTAAAKRWQELGVEEGWCATGSGVAISGSWRHSTWHGRTAGRRRATSSWPATTRGGGPVSPRRVPGVRGAGVRAGRRPRQGRHALSPPGR